MRVELSVDVFLAIDDVDSYDPNDLHSLLRCFPDGRHDWVTNHEVVAAVAKHLPKCLPRLADTYVALARKGMVEQAWTGKTQLHDVVRVGLTDLADCSADLCRPAVLVVENSGSDGAFLTAVAHALRHERILTALKQSWLEVHSAGGSGEVVRVVREHVSRYRQLIRVVALLDSDSLIPQQRTGNHDRADELAGMDVKVHVLTRREAENYVPHRVLATIGKHKETSRKLSLLRRLTPQQRSHIDMKHGFTKAERSKAVRDQLQQLFHDLELEVRLGLHDGFGDDLLERLALWQEQLTERDFATLGEDVVDELRKLLDLVASRI
ncbi:hypothetical protein [Micromonospora sp. NPDC047134]|uniref:hypothetical protein n=1 Tax=Micromonospora sp. NPDC047134 TaxID=3154340 RepID=UPI0033CCE0A8